MGFYFRFLITLVWAALYLGTRLIDFVRNPISGFPTGYKPVIVHMMKFLMAFYILVLFFSSFIPLYMPLEVSLKAHFVSIQP